MAKGRNKNGTFAKGNKCAEKWSEEEAIKLGDELLEWMYSRIDNVFFEDFFVVEKKLYPTIYSFLIEKFEPFSKRIELAKKIQEIRISKGCLTNEFNGGFGKFFLSANHGMSEKSITEVEQKGEAPTIKLEIIEDNRK